jgi:hypothetical protein
VTRLVRAVFAAALVLGCASNNGQNDAPPPTCVGDCGLPPGLGSGLPPTDGGDGGPGEGGTSGTGVVLTGTVQQINDETNFVTTGPFTSTATLQAEGADGTTVTGMWDGSNPFALQGVVSAAPAWVLTTPLNAAAVDALPAMEPVNTNSPNAQGVVTANIGLVRSTTIDAIFSLTTTPISNDTTKGQIILRLVDKTSTSAMPPALSGVSVSVPSAQVILYGASGSFSDVANATDPTGVVVLANVGAASWPGALVSVEFSGTRSGGAQIRAVTGAVTLTTLGL